jgi:hypothetical protein
MKILTWFRRRTEKQLALKAETAKRRRETDELIKQQAEKKAA